MTRLKDLALKLEGKHIVHVNSTYIGGGVAEILNSLIVLMNVLGIDTEWRLLKGSHSFFDVTKKFHNALQGGKVQIFDRDMHIYLEELERNALMQHFREHDLVFIHDPQPLGLIKYITKRRQPWIWRCHIEMRNADPFVWRFLQPFANQYDGAIFSLQQYRQPDLDMSQYFIMPSIDPLSMKNQELADKTAVKLIEKEGIELDRPLITQVSRFDRWKNPLGVLRLFKRIRRKTDAQLVLIGDMAGDDPESPRIYNKVVRSAGKDRNIHIITKKDDLLVNALQKMSHVVFQLSIREGFGLTVSEAMWKKTPVIGTNTGGIPMQIKNGETGALISSESEGVDWCVKLIRDDALRRKMGEAAREHVKQNFLITRQLYDYLNLIDHYTGTVADDVMLVAKNLQKMILR